MPNSSILTIVTPIFKGGGKSEPANYRLVSLTNHLTKIFEKVIRKEVVERNHFFNITQHGFTEGKSTISQLLSYYDSILSMLVDDRGRNSRVDAIYLDFAKAFDKVDHDILLQKLHRLGVQGKIHNWMATFLKDRVQQVRVNGVLSQARPVISGVPQGSVLGPLFFLIMILDINNSIGSFADDTKLWGLVRCLNDSLDLQKDLDEI